MLNTIQPSKEPTLLCSASSRRENPSLVRVKAAVGAKVPNLLKNRCAAIRCAGYLICFGYDPKERILNLASIIHSNNECWH